MAIENSLYDKKSLKTVTGKTADFSELAKDCVAFANSKGGCLDIGIEDAEELPPENQKVSDELVVKIEKRISESTINVSTAVEKSIAKNGGEYIKLHVLYNKASIASTSDGKYYMRVGDSSKPVKADEISVIFTDRPPYMWETQKTLSKYADCDKEKLTSFLRDVRNATRVSDFVKSKSDEALLSYYHLINGEYLTNLGALWLGNYFQRSNLGTSPRVQVIKYDGHGDKINKFMYCDDDMSPKELIDAIWRDVPDWREYYEIPNTIHRERVYAYEYKVIRELLVNAIVHRPYTMGGHIFIKLYPERMEITNPGSLPLGITPENILNTSFQRNEAFGKIFFDLDYMEKEGSGYHLLYQLLLLNGKPLPVVEEGRDWVKVTVMRKPVNDNEFLFMFRINKEHELTQKQAIELGLLSQKNRFSIAQIAKILDISEQDAFTIIDEIYTAGIISKYEGRDLYVLKGINLTDEEDDSINTPQVVEDDLANDSVNAMETTRKTTRKTTQKTTQKIIELMKSNPNITQQELAEQCKITLDGIKWQIKQLKKNKIITRIGSDKAGYWQIIEKLTETK